MKANHYILFLLLLPFLLWHQNTEAQRNTGALNIRGDTLYLDTKNSVAIVFPAAPNKADIADSDGSYEVADMGKNALSVKALKSGATNQMLEVTEGSRNHLFVLSYKEGSPAQRIDVSTKKKLETYAREKKKNVLQALAAADDLYKKASTNPLNQAAWENVAATYQQLERAVDSKDAGVVKGRLEESSNEIKRIKGKKYEAAMKKGQDYALSKNCKEAKNAYTEALMLRPGDVQALKNIGIVDSVCAKDLATKGDAAYKVKNYVLAKACYKEALGIRPDDPALLNKFNQVKKDADPLIYKIEKERCDLALKADDIKEARRACDSALAVQPNDKYMNSQLKKIMAGEEKIEEEEKREAQYQSVLVKAKSLTDAASNVQGYDLAIKEYEKALIIIPTRKFPKKRIDELTKIKSGSR